MDHHITILRGESFNFQLLGGGGGGSSYFITVRGKHLSAKLQVGFH